MKNERLAKFCEYFYASHYIPIALYGADGKLQKSWCSDEGIGDFYQAVFDKAKSETKNPAVYTSSAFGRYGAVKVDSSKCTVVIGPTFNGTVSDKMVAAFIHANGIDWAKKNEVSTFLASIPQYTYNQFLNLLAFLHLQLNGEAVSVTEHFNITADKFSQAIAEKHVETLYEAKDVQIVHGTYYFEQQLLEIVKSGNTEKLKEFFGKALSLTPMNEGRLADDALRQAKNLLIGIATMAGKSAAIRGGLDVEQTYQLIDEYVLECENCQSVDAVKSLQYNMLVDFTDRVAQAKTPPDISPEIFEAVQYIRMHTNTPIGIPDVVLHVKKSRAWLTAKFKAEMGATVGEYISRCKLEEAKGLLLYSNKSLVEISSYFYFSSQSYFSNLFKNKYGLAPAAYRKKHRA